jgi:hypothetical protein
MKRGIKIKFEKSNNKFAFLPEINFAWSKRYYFFIFVSWFKYTWSYNFINI